jgi:hypothetical protein
MEDHLAHVDGVTVLELPGPTSHLLSMAMDKPVAAPVVSKKRKAEDDVDAESMLASDVYFAGPASSDAGEETELVYSEQIQVGDDAGVVGVGVLDGHRYQPFQRISAVYYAMSFLTPCVCIVSEVIVLLATHSCTLCA